MLYNVKCSCTTLKTFYCSFRCRNWEKL